MGSYESMQAANQEIETVNLTLLRAAIRFNSIVLGLTGGTIAAITIYFLTHASLAKWGEDAGTYLGLLGVFLPGYTVTRAGALIGAFWGFGFFGIVSALSYRLYGTVLGTRIADELLGEEASENPVLKPSIMRLHGVSLGLAMGAMGALGLFFSTSWLVIRGTASESVHAALLSNYIPGYSVSILGGLVGAMQLFIVIFLACYFLAAVYNKIVEKRHR